MRFKRRYKSRSRVVKMKFQSFFDIATKDGEMQIISVNAGGDDVIKRLAPFFSAYKYYKLGGVSFKLIPASTLPVDPTGLSIEAGDNLVDPRDQLTPGMCRITNGEDILEDITGLSADAQHQLYNNMLLDPRWFKWMLQTGVKRFGTPRYWQIGQLHQDKWPGAVTNVPEVNLAAIPTPLVTGTVKYTEAHALNGARAVTVAAGSSPYGIFQTGHRGVLGWMPTSGDSLYLDPNDATVKRQPTIASVPTVELFKILTPPAYKTVYWYRAFVTETVFFKDPIVMNVNDYRPIDVFHRSLVPIPSKPTTNVEPISDSLLDTYTGGNDGSD